MKHTFEMSLKTLDVPHRGLFLGMSEKDQNQGFSFIEYAASLA